ncbi:MAG: hypothetical protein DCF32_21930 [Leptolyngbya sp.]|nr:MAG: hypothetical protein DCF32_21930 [Leptolyngbya sp.]
MQFVRSMLRRFAKRKVCGILETGIDSKRVILRGTLLLLLPLLLSGCLRYDLTLRFDHQSHGQISQTIDLSDRGAALAQLTLEPWLEELKVRSRPLGGQLSQSPQTLTLTVPFGTAADLGDRFRQLFAAVSPKIESVSAEEPSPADRPTYLQLPGWEPVPFALAIDQTNWLLASRTHLTYRIDLRQLPPNGDDLADSFPWADLHFRLQVPWGLAELAPTATPPTQQDVTGATWSLEPGEITTIDATFWLPNAIALGTLGIAALVLTGYSLRYRIFKPKFPIG